MGPPKVNTTRSKAGKETIITNPDLVRTIQLGKWFSKIPSLHVAWSIFGQIPPPSALSKPSLFTISKLMVNGVGVIIRRRPSKGWVRLKSTIWSTQKAQAVNMLQRLH